jgi:hypothetical protein
MPYSLVSAATLGFDLVRLPAGRRVADVVLTGLAADDAVLSRLAAAHPSNQPDSARGGEQVIRSRRARELAAAVPRVHAGLALGDTAREERLALLVSRLEHGTIGDAAGVERLLRTDVLGSSGRLGRPGDPAGGLADVLADAADVLADAAVGYWAAGVLPRSVEEQLTGPFESVQPTLPVSGEAIEVDLGPAAPRLQALLWSLRSLDGAGRARWRTAVDLTRGARRDWAAAMHDACWAAHLSGRTRALAAAHMYAVRAFLDGGFGVRDGAHGMWNAIAGCVQAMAMADLLDDRSLAVLQAPWEHVSASRPV